MANYNEVMLGFQFIYTVLSGDSLLTGYAPGGVWRGSAPPETPTPFIVMIHQAGTDVITMNAFRILADYLYQVKVVGPASITAQTSQAAARVDRLLGGPPGGPTAGAVVISSAQVGNVDSCYRQSPLQLDELVAGEVWSNIGGLYRLEIQQIAT